MSAIFTLGAHVALLGKVAGATLIGLEFTELGRKCWQNIENI